MEQEHSSPEELPFYKTDKLPQTLAGLSIATIIGSGVVEQIPDWAPVCFLSLMIGSLVYLSRISD